MYHSVAHETYRVCSIRYYTVKTKRLLACISAQQTRRDAQDEAQRESRVFLLPFETSAHRQRRLEERTTGEHVWNGTVEYDVPYRTH